MAAQQLKDVIQGGDPRNTSHGRGGAGNISNVTKKDVDAQDLATPTLKGTTYTTGRGGSGNIVSNENADVARAAQDVEAPAHHEKAPTGTYHWGRGGEGNMMTIGGDGSAKRSTSKEPPSNTRRGSFQGALEKLGKDMLGLNKGKKQERSGSIVEEKA